MSKLKSIIKKFIYVLFGYKLIKNIFPERQNINKILVISLYFTGDLLFHTASLEALKKLIPKSKVDIWAKSRSKEVLNNNPHINDVLVYDNISTADYREKTKFDLHGKINIIKCLRKKKYDVIVDLTGKYSTALITLLANSKYTIGINYNYFGFCYDKFIPLNTSTQKGHLIDKYLSVIKSGFRITDNEWNKIKQEISIKPYMYTGESDKFVIDELLTSKFQNINAKYVLLHLSSGWKAKELPIEIFSELILYFEEKKIKYLIIGDDKDYDKTIEIKKYINNQNVNVLDKFVKLKLHQSAELISRAALLIGSDSAPLHMAGAFNTPSIGLFGPTNPDFSNPIGNKHKYIYFKLHCSSSDDRQYCTRNGGFTCPYYECMHSISSGKIISHFNQLYTIDN